MSGHAVVMGDLVLDLVAVLGEALQYGSDTRGEIFPRPGGSAANTATWLARLGHPVRFVGRVGQDPLGTLLVNGLEREGVTPVVALDPEAPSAIILAMTDPSGERSMIISPGANHRLSPADFPIHSLDGAGVLHLTGYSFFWAAPRAAARTALSAARERGVPVSVDASSASLLREFGPQDFLAEVRGVRCLLCNLEEGQLLTGHADPEAVLAALAGEFPVVGLKLGRAGALCTAGGTVARVPAASARVVDSTGCGDSWNAGLLAGTLAGLDLPAAAGLAGRTAAWVVARPGAVPPGWTDADRVAVWQG